MNLIPFLCASEAWIWILTGLNLCVSEAAEAAGSAAAGPRLFTAEGGLLQELGTVFAESLGAIWR